MGPPETAQNRRRKSGGGQQQCWPPSKLKLAQV